MALFLYVCLAIPEIFEDTDADEDDELFFFYHTVIMSYMNSAAMFVQLCHTLSIYETPVDNLTFF